MTAWEAAAPRGSGRRGVTAFTAALAGLVLTAGCSSSGSSATPSGPAKTSAKTPAVTSAAASPSPAPTSAAPVSPFESDPAVMAMRAWAVQAAKTVNSGAYDDAALDALMTPALAKTMSNVLGGDVGLYYPGPLPFSPLAVTMATATQHEFSACSVSTGFAQNPTTHQPAAARTLQATTFGAELVNGKWLVSKQEAATQSCDGIAIPEPTW